MLARPPGEFMPLLTFFFLCPFVGHVKVDLLRVLEVTLISKGDDDSLKMKETQGRSIALKIVLGHSMGGILL